MLTEQFIASIGTQTRTASTGGVKDAAIFIHEYQPSTAQRSVFKKSCTFPNSLAVSGSHVFAAQAEKAVVHVYSRDKGNQEATVPFTEKITCLSLACDGTVLILGTAEGRILLWELATGRQITTAQAHLQSVTVLAIDEASNTLLSGSADSTVHVWSIQELLAFSTANTSDTQSLAPKLTISSHRAEVTGLTVGHGRSTSNFAVSVSKDQSCLVWNFHTGALLRTYLLPSIPSCLALDPADRAIYVGYDDGSLQALNLYDTKSSKSAIQDASNDGSDSLGPIQPNPATRWSLPNEAFGPALSLSVSYDGSQVLSGHQSGKIIAWDVATGRFLSNLTPAPMPGPVTNLAFLPVTGFERHQARSLDVQSVVKPRYGAFSANEDGNVSGNYNFQARFPSNLHSASLSAKSKPSAFETALTSPVLPFALLQEGIADLAAWNSTVEIPVDSSDDVEQEDFMALDAKPSKLGAHATLETENVALKKQLEALRRVQAASFDRLEKVDAERRALLASKGPSRSTDGGLANGHSDDEMEDLDDSDSAEDEDSDDN